jgi:membrane protein
MREWIGIFTTAAKRFGENNGMRMAAALSYYAVFSIPPLLMLLLLLLGFLVDPQDVVRLLQTEIGDLLGPGAVGQLQEITQHVRTPDLQNPVAAAFGFGALLLGAIGAFTELQSAMNQIWRVKPHPERSAVGVLLRKRLLSFGMILVLGFFLLVALLVNVAIATLSDLLAELLPAAVAQYLIPALASLLSLLVVTALFAWIFMVLPDAENRLRTVLPGAVFTAVLFLVGQFLIGLYFSRSDPGSAFGVAGSLALILVWIYYSALLVFFGAEFTRAWIARRGGGVRPEKGAVSTEPGGNAGQRPELRGAA